LADLHFRRVQMTEALIQIQRGTAPTDREDLLLNAAMRLLADRHDGVPVLGDLLRVIRDAPQELRAVALDRGDNTRYLDLTEALEVSLMGLAGDGRLGATFSQPTTEPMRLTPWYDISGIDGSETDLQAAALLACWSPGSQRSLRQRCRGPGTAAALLGHPRRVVARHPYRSGHGRLRRRVDPAEPQQGGGAGDGVSHHERSGRTRQRGGPQEGGRVERRVEDRRVVAVRCRYQTAELSRREQDMLVSWQAPGNPRATPTTHHQAWANCC
jgi:hypothetical protein